MNKRLKNLVILILIVLFVSISGTIGLNLIMEQFGETITFLITGILIIACLYLLSMFNPLKVCNEENSELLQIKGTLHSLKETIALMPLEEREKWGLGKFHSQ